jgi:ABC-type phosphate transport system permease subunit
MMEISVLLIKICIAHKEGIYLEEYTALNMINEE